LNAATVFGSAPAGSSGSVISCAFVRSCRCWVITLRSTGWLNHIAMSTALVMSAVFRYHSVRMRRIVGVMKENVDGLPSVLPLIAFAVPSIVTSYFVAYGSGDFGSGVKISVVVPDQRNVPGIAGATLNQGGVTSFGILPTTTIGSEKTTRISLASAIW